jgi:hypothetical protein
MHKTEQQTRLEAAGWQCSKTRRVQYRVGQGAVLEEIVVWLSKDHHEIDVSASLNDERRAWEFAWLEAKRADSAGLTDEATSA